MKNLSATQKDSVLHFLRDFECKASKAGLLPNLLLLQEEYGFGGWTVDELIEFLVGQISNDKATEKAQP